MPRRRSLFARPYDHLHQAAVVHAQIAAGDQLEHEHREPNESARKPSRRGASAKSQRRSQGGQFA